MGRRPRTAAISGVMRHGTLAYRAGTRVSRDVVGSSGRATVARPAGDGAGPRVRPHGGAHPGPTPHEKTQSAAPTSRRLRLSVTSPAGERGARPPASLRGTMENGPTGQMRPGNPPPGCGGVPPGSASLGLRSGTSRKSAVWAEGLADGAPWARPGHHQAASCGLRRCRKLRVRRNPLVSSTFLSLETDRRRAVGPFLSRPTIGERPPSASCLAPLSP